MRENRLLSFLIWTYAILLITEGGLRRWVFPGLAEPLLLIRDPIAILGIIEGIRTNLIPKRPFIIALFLFFIPTVILAISAGHGNILVATYGFRTNYLHLVFMFVIGAGTTLITCRHICTFILISSIPMTALMAAQFFSPQGSFINIGVGGEGDAGFSGAMGYNRPPGTFSFISGPTYFFPFVAAVALHYILSRPTKMGYTLAIAALLATVLAIPFSISRALLLGVAAVLIASPFVAIISKNQATQLIKFGFAACIILATSSMLPIMETPKEAFLARWVASTDDRGGVQEALIDRITEGFSDAFGTDIPNPILGTGLGAGTNAGSKLLTGEVTFLVSETEWRRITGELGIPIGTLFIAIRVLITFWLLLIALRSARRNSTLPLLLWFAGAPLMLNGQWGSPTILGFTSLICGLIVASSSSEDSNFIDSRGDEQSIPLHAA